MATVMSPSSTPSAMSPSSTPSAQAKPKAYDWPTICIRIATICIRIAATIAISICWIAATIAISIGWIAATIAIPIGRIAATIAIPIGRIAATIVSAVSIPPIRSVINATGISSAIVASPISDLLQRLSHVQIVFSQDGQR